MVNKVVLEYLRKHSKKYKVEALRGKIISSGYSEEEVDEALVALGLKKLTDVVKPMNPVAVSPKPVEKVVEPVVKPVQQVVKPIIKQKPKKSFFKSLFSGSEKKVVKPVEKKVVRSAPVKSVKPIIKQKPKKSFFKSLFSGSEKKVVKPVEKKVVRVIPKKIIPRKVSKIMTAGRKESSFKWLKAAGVSALVLVVLFILFYIFLSGLFGLEVYILSPFAFVSFLLIALFSILFYFGFIILGKRFDNKLLGVVSWVFIFAVALFILFQIFFMIFPDVIENTFFNAVDLESPDIMDKMNLGEVADSFIELFILVVAAASVMAILNVLFGIGVMKLSTRYSKLAGILHIAGGASLFVGIGALILLAALIVDAALLFVVSKSV